MVSVAQNYVALSRSNILGRPHPASASGLKEASRRQNSSAENLSKNADSDDFYAASYSLAPSVIPETAEDRRETENQDAYTNATRIFAGTPDGRKNNTGATP